MSRRADDISSAWRDRTPVLREAATSAADGPYGRGRPPGATEADLRLPPPTVAAPRVGIHAAANRTGSRGPGRRTRRSSTALRPKRSAPNSLSRKLALAAFARHDAVPEDRAARAPRRHGARTHTARDREAKRLRAAGRHGRGTAGALPLHRLPALHRRVDPHDERVAEGRGLPPDRRRLRAEAASHGAVYLEGIFSPAERVRRGCSWEDVFEGVCNGAQEAKELHGVEIRLTPDIPRGFTQEEARETVDWCARYMDRGVVGVGLGGLEAEFPPEPYEAVFKHAKTLGLGSVPHAGEVAGAGVGTRRAREPGGGPAPARHPRRGGSRARRGSSPTAARCSTSARSRISVRAP